MGFLKHAIIASATMLIVIAVLLLFLFPFVKDSSQVQQSLSLNTPVSEGEIIDKYVIQKDLSIGYVQDTYYIRIQSEDGSLVRDICLDNLTWKSLEIGEFYKEA